MSDDDRAPDRDRDREQPSGLFGVIRHVLGSLVDAERSGGRDVRGTGRRSGRRYSIEYGFSGRVGERPPGTASRAGADADYLVDVREADDAVLVVADLPDVERDDLAVGLADGRSVLVIRVDGRPIEQIELPWPVDAVEPRLHHGVLEIRITPAEANQ